MDSERNAKLHDIAKDIENLVRKYGRRDDIIIEGGRLTENDMGMFTEHNRKWLNLFAGEEYFLVCEIAPDGKHFTNGLLYAVNVSGDSLLTAAEELMSLVARKF